MKFLNSDKGTYKLYRVGDGSTAYSTSAFSPVMSKTGVSIVATSLEEAIQAWKNQPGRDNRIEPAYAELVGSVIIVAPEE